ncbi:MAG: CRISPR-associated protein Cas4 [Promethearchaeota archaeon]
MRNIYEEKNSEFEEEVVRYYNLRLKNPYFRLYGLLDVVEVKGNEIYPVDRKTGKAPEQGVYRPHRFQLAAQAYLIEANFGKDVSKSVIEYSKEGRREITISIKDKIDLIRILNEMRQIVSQEKLPRPTPHVGKCADCEYWKKCRRL